jgi:hypothetical protein
MTRQRLRRSEASSEFEALGLDWTPPFSSSIDLPTLGHSPDEYFRKPDSPKKQR